MAKKKRNDTLNSMALQNTTKIIEKRGKLKGKNKKQTKALKAACPHHVIGGKNGDKIKPKIVPITITNPETGLKEDSIACKLCKTHMSPKPYKTKEIKKSVKNLISINDQAKFLAAACGCGAKTLDYLSGFGVELRKYAKIVTRVNNVALKANKIKSTKKSKLKSDDYGTWKRK